MRVIIRIPSFSCSKNVINIHFLQVENSLHIRLPYSPLPIGQSIQIPIIITRSCHSTDKTRSFWLMIKTRILTACSITFNLGFLWRLWLLHDKFLAMKNIMNLQLGIFSVSFFKEFLSTKLQDCSKFFFVKWITPEAKIIRVKKGK